MRIPRIRLSYANIVSTMALFLALGGVSYAAVKLPANSVGEKQIKKNAVTGKKIKKNAITGDKIKAGTITGGDVNLASLGKVPSAENADKSAKTDQVIGIAKKVSPSFTGSVSMDNTRVNATPIPLASNSQVSVYGKCFVYSGTVFAEAFQATTADGALSSVSTNYWYGSGGYLNTSTLENQRYFITATASSNNAYGPGGSSGSNVTGAGSLYGPDGNGLNFHVQLWAKQGTPTPYGNGAYGAGDVCIFNTSAIKLNAG